MALDDRKKSILRAIVEGYIQNAEPVGSRSIAKNTDLNLSAATIRNEMGDLEEMGFLVQPHTSAGRIPSSQGFRFYVDSLMERYRMTAAEIQQMRSAMLHKIRELDKIVKDVSSAFSNITNLPTFGMVPTLNTGPSRRLSWFLLMKRPSWSLYRTAPALSKISCSVCASRRMMNFWRSSMRF